MRRKLRVLIVILTLIITSMNVLFISNKDICVKADFGGQNEITLDLGLVYNVTQNLSNVIYDAYSEGEPHKGRAYGSKGENYAADYLYDKMSDMRLIHVLPHFKNQWFGLREILCDNLPDDTHINTKITM